MCLIILIMPRAELLRHTVVVLSWNCQKEVEKARAEKKIAPQVLMPRGIHAASFWLTA